MGSLISNSTCCSVNEGEHGYAMFETTPWKSSKTKNLYRGCLNGKGQLTRKNICVKAGQEKGWEKENCRETISKCENVQELAKSFNNRKCSSMMLEILVPDMALMDKTASFQKFTQRRSLSSKEWVLFEEKLDKNFQIFVDKNGFTRSYETTSLTAFVHFTYHATFGELVVCGLKGCNSGRKFKLSNPTVHFGQSDDGANGIKTVFMNHKCNEVCKGWLLPDFSDARVITTKSADEKCEPSAPFVEENVNYDTRNGICSRNPESHAQGHCHGLINDHHSYMRYNAAWLQNYYERLPRFAEDSGDF